MVLVSYVTSKIWLLRAQCSHIDKYTWASPDGKTHQIDDILTDSRWPSSIADVRYFSGTDCDTGHYLVVANVRERLVSKQVSSREVSYGEIRFQGAKCGERENHQLKISNRFATSENSDDWRAINGAWENKRISEAQLKRV
jgi:hypothetical protein